MCTHRETDLQQQQQQIKKKITGCQYVCVPRKVLALDDSEYHLFTREKLD